MRTGFALLALLFLATPAPAGLHLALEPARPLPAQWRGFLADLRLVRQLRDAADPPPLRDSYTDARLRLEAKAKAGPLSPDDAAELGGVLVRLGEPARAVAVLRAAARLAPGHFRLAANLGTAWQLSGELGAATESLAEAVRLAPAEFKPAEAAQLRLVRGRAGKETGLDDVLTPGATLAESVALVQRLSAWLPNDGRLLWRLAELASDAEDARAAALLMDAAGTDSSIDSPRFRARRGQLRAAADALDAAGTPSPGGKIAFRSPRLLLRTVDPARLPPVRADGSNPFPWAVLRDAQFTGGKWVIPDYLLKLDGLEVRATGTIAPVGSVPAGGLTGFLFTESPVGCWYCDAPGPTRTLSVELAPGRVAEPARQAVRVVGTLRVNRADPEAYPLRLERARVLALD